MRCYFVFLVSILLWITAQSCITPQGIVGECVPFYKCQNLVKEVLNTKSLRVYKESLCGLEGKVIKVCCGKATKINEEDEGAIESLWTEDSEPASEDICGTEMNGDRILSGVVAQLDEFPWIALLGYKGRNDTMLYKCSGFLINKRFVVTAGHCISNNLLTVRLGEYNIKSKVDCVDDKCEAFPVQEIPIQKAIRHPGYIKKASSNHNDIAILKLERQVNYAYNVRSICLSHEEKDLEDGSNVLVAGWGRTSAGLPSDIKLKLSIPIYNKKTCRKMYEQYSIKVLESQICAGGIESRDSCYGDSGGPLMFRTPQGIWEAAGVVSFGNGCGRAGWPAVYTNVRFFTDWIKAELKKN